MKLLFGFIFFIWFANIAGCNRQEKPAAYVSHIVLTADPYLPLMKEEINQYISLYPKVKMEALNSTTREAIVNLINDSVHCIVIDRQFNEEEQNAAKQASLKIVEYKIAEDGVAIIVNKQNSIPSISVEFVRRIIKRDIKYWSQAGWSISGPIDLVLTGRNSGMYELLQKKIFSLAADLEPTTIMNNQNEVIQYVSTHPKSIGYVAASLVINRTSNVKVLPVQKEPPEWDQKEYLPGQQEIYSSLYPFHYSLYLYNAETDASAGVGFSAMVLSNIGQKIIQKSGLIPASIPYRTIQLMRSEK